jgi:hypothetical protein
MVGMTVVGHNAFRIVNDPRPPILTLFRRNEFVVLGQSKSTAPRPGVLKITIVPRISSSCTIRERAVFRRTPYVSKI